MVENPKALEQFKPGTVKVLEASISQELMERAIRITTWFLREIRRLRRQHGVPPEIADAKALLDWCHTRLKPTGNRLLVYPHMVTWGGPHRFRSERKRFEAALSILIRHGWARRQPAGTQVDGSPRKDVWEIVRKPE